MRSFPLHDLTPREFEELVVLICERVLGTGTINFSTGKDGGRDAKFTGKAEQFPSKERPWEGKFVVQAKHTEKPVAKCSDPDFKGVLEKEVKKLKVLKEEGRVDYYLVFTNRRLSGIAEAKISDFIETQVEVENQVIGDERIQLWLGEYPDISKTLNLNNLLLPLKFYEQDLKDIIIKFSRIKTELAEEIDKKLRYVGLERKNELNKLGKEYFDFMRKNSFSYFRKIDKFLENPANRKYKMYYDNTVSDLQEEIIVKRSEYDQFREIFSDLYKYILDNNMDSLKERRKLVRVFLHYMYFNCDIGVGE